MKKILSILLLVSMLTIAFTACDTTPPIENEDSTPQNSTEGASNTANEDSEQNNSTNNNNSNNNADNTNDNNNSSNDSNTPSTALTEEEKYNNAISLLSQGKNEEAYKLLNEIKTYTPAKEKLKNFFYAPKTVNETRKYSDWPDQTNSTTYTYNSIGNIIETSDGKIFTYDADGNVLSGCDLIYGEYYTYTYKNGKLYQRKSSDTTETYYYDSNDLLSKTVIEYRFGTDEYIYEYTYYSNGKIKTTINDSYKYFYNESGNLTQVDLLDSNGVYATMTMTYGEYGLTTANFQDIWGGMAIFTYSYDTNGILTKLEVKAYEEGIWEFTNTFTFADHQLYYSENNAVLERIDIINYTDIEAALDIIM